MTENTYETILVRREGRVGVITLNRPKALNALNVQTMTELVPAAPDLARDPEIGAIVLTGSEKAFAAGADIKEMGSKTGSDMYREDFFSAWDTFARLRTPKIAAVAGYALGGGCEAAMMCDMIIAADTAKFGQPEITLGVIPGMGGTQRLTRAVGKAKAVDLILTGRRWPSPPWRPSTPRTRPPWPRDCSTSAACSTGCSPPRTRRRAWRPSRRSGSRTSPTSEPRLRPVAQMMC